MPIVETAVLQDGTGPEQATRLAAKAGAAVTRAMLGPSRARPWPPSSY